MTWTNHNNDKFIYMLNLDTLDLLSTSFADKYQGIDFVANKTNKATTVSVDTIESMSIATIITNTPQGLYYFPNIDVQYTNEITKQFAFITENITKTLITNDKQLMMKIIKKIIKEKIIKIEHWKTATVLYNNAIEKQYQIYKTLNDKIKSL